MKVLIIPEDFTLDQYILRPLIQAMFKRLDNAKARVEVCRDPRLGGVTHATNLENIQLILERHPMFDLYLLCVDRDGKEGRRTQLNKLEYQAKEMLPQSRLLLAENAWQEIEVWALAGHDLPINWSWSVIRAEIDPKELYFFPFAKQKGLIHDSDLIYKTLGQEATKNYGRIRTRCPEVLELETRIQSWNPA